MHILLQGKLLWSRGPSVSGSMSCLFVCCLPLSHEICQKPNSPPISFRFHSPPPPQRFLGFRSVISQSAGSSAPRSRSCSAFAGTARYIQSRGMINIQNRAAGHASLAFAAPSAPSRCPASCRQQQQQRAPAAARRILSAHRRQLRVFAQAAATDTAPRFVWHNSSRQRGVFWTAGGLTARLPAAVGRLQRWRCHR